MVRLLGGEGELQSSMGLSPDAFYNVISQMGNYSEIFERAAAGNLAVDWFEVLTENFMVAGGKPLRMLDAICAERPVVLHGVSLDIGGVDPLHAGYLRDLEQRVSFGAGAASRHMCGFGARVDRRQREHRPGLDGAAAQAAQRVVGHALACCIEPWQALEQRLIAADRLDAQVLAS